MPKPTEKELKECFGIYVIQEKNKAEGVDEKKKKRRDDDEDKPKYDPLTGQLSLEWCGVAIRSLGMTPSDAELSEILGASGADQLDVAGFLAAAAKVPDAGWRAPGSTLSPRLPPTATRVPPSCFPRAVPRCSLAKRWPPARPNRAATSSPRHRAPPACRGPDCRDH
jgi:hypothetical protein